MSIYCPTAIYSTLSFLFLFPPSILLILLLIYYINIYPLWRTAIHEEESLTYTRE